MLAYVCVHMYICVGVCEPHGNISIFLVLFSSLLSKVGLLNELGALSGKTDGRRALGICFHTHCAGVRAVCSRG